jgi:hypothetical protein
MVRIVGADGDGITVVTGGDGTWRADVSDGVYGITFSHSGGYMTEQFDNYIRDRFGFTEPRRVGVAGRDVPHVDAQLARAGVLRGRIVKDGAPVAGAYVELERQIAGGGDDPEAQSGPDGRFSIPDLVPGTYRVTYSFHEGGEDVPTSRGGRSGVIVRSGEEVDLADLSSPDDSMHGSIELSTDGKGVTGEVSIYSVKDPVNPVWEKHGSVYPGSPSVYPGLPAGSYKISYGWSNWDWVPNSWVGGLSFFTAETVVVEPGETTHVSVSPGAEEPMNEAAYVLNTRYQNLAGITVLLRRADHPDEVVATAHTRLSGLYRFDALPRAEYLLTFVDPAGRYATTTIPLDPDALNIILKRRRSPEMEPIGDVGFSARVREVGRTSPRPVYFPEFYRADDGGSRERTLPSSDDESGESLTSLRPGTFKIKLGSAHWYGGRSFSTATPVTLSPGTVTDIEMGTLPTNGTLTGSATGADGVVLKDAVAVVYPEDDPSDVIALEQVDGRFTVRDLPVRPYKIRIDDPTGRYASSWVGGGDSFASARSFTPEISEETEIGSATLPRWTGPAPWDVPSSPPVVNMPRRAAPVPLKVLKSPRISGTPRVGRTLRTTAPTFSRPPSVLVRTWYRDGRRIGGASRTTYRLKNKDRGHRITYRVTVRASDEQKVVAVSRPTRRVSRHS